MTLREWAHSGPFTLTLSAGFFGFFAHAGLMSALEEADLPPSRLAGSSAGALVAGLWASGRDATELRKLLFDVKRQDFWDPAPGWGLLKGRLFARILDDLLGATTFEACRAPLAVSVFDVRQRQALVLDAGPLAPAIQASCTFPGLFHPVSIDGRPFIDGGVADRSGLSGVPADQRVLYHHLSTRSRWRRRFARLTGCPRREGMIPLIVEGLPSVGPFRLSKGKQAFARAYEAVTAALDQPVEPGGPPHYTG